MKRAAQIITVDRSEYLSIDSLSEFGSKNQATEVELYNIEKARILSGNTIQERFKHFFHFEIKEELSLGEGYSPLIKSRGAIAKLLHHNSIYLKNETTNPTWSFKDKGSWAMSHHTLALGEKLMATVSTGNMGNSTAAYASRAGFESLVIVPSYASMDKIKAASIAGANILSVNTNNFSNMKKWLADWAPKNNLRLSSGNNPIRVEGYKLTAFNLFEQFNGNLPDYIAIPTSACGHIRGVFKGFVELKKAGYIETLPKMIIVQASGNAPLVNALEKGMNKPDIVDKPNTIASAITTGNPLGGEEIIEKAFKHNWLFEKVSEEEILEGQKLLAQEGIFVEPSAATLPYAIKKLIDADKIHKNESVVMVLTGGGLKDHNNIKIDFSSIIKANDDVLEKTLLKLTNYK